jgi:hypothetical protein
VESSQAFPLDAEHPINDLVWSDTVAEALAREGHGLQLSFSWIKGELQPARPLRADPDRLWAEVDLPVLLAQDAPFRFG